MKRIIALVLAAMMAATLFTGCGKNGGNNKKEEIPTLTWYVVGGGKPANYDSWTEKVNAYLEEKIGVHLNYQCVPWGDWDDRHKAIVSTNEPYDIMFTNDINYAAEVAMGAYADLTELIQEVPELQKSIPDDVWQGCAINGRIYAIPTYKDCAAQEFLVWKKDVVEKYFPDWENAHTLQDVEPALEAIKAAGVLPMAMTDQGCMITYDNLGTGLAPMGVSYDYQEGDGVPQVVSTFEQPDMMEKFETLHRWFEKGYINADAAVVKEIGGEYGFGFAQGWPSAIQIWQRNRGYDCVCTEFEVPRLSSTNIQGSLNCISKTSEHKAEALKLLQLVNTDRKLRDMLAYGEEGVNFNYVEEEDMQKISRDADHPWTFAGYTQGSFFIMSTESGTAGNYWVDEVRVQNERALVSPAVGFYFNPEKVADKLDACRSIYMEYKASIQTGTADPHAAVPEMIGRLNESGFQEILTEAQTQMDAWWEATHK